MQCTYSTCLAFFLFSLHPSSPLSVSQPQTLLSAPTVKMRWSLGNHSACCSHHHWMLSWRSWDSEVKSDYSPDKWGVCVCVSGGAHTRQQLWQKIVKGYTWWVVGPLWASATTEHCHFFRTSILPLSLSLTLTHFTLRFTVASVLLTHDLSIITGIICLWPLHSLFCLLEVLQI